MKAIIGLGNPGSRYKNNRHNVGFMVLDALAKEAHLAFKRSFRFSSHKARFTLDDEDVLLVKPLTFMNRSGACVKKVLKACGLGPDHCLVVYDDADLDLGTIRFRLHGSGAGHRGLTSIMEEMGTQEVARLKIGIGRPPERQELADYVLEDVSRDQKPFIETAIERAVCACLTWVAQGASAVMSEYNRVQA